MSMLLWHGDGDDDAIDLGDPGVAWRAFGEIAGVVGDDPGFDELQSVPGFAEQAVTPWWLAQVKAQAAALLRRHGPELSDAAHRLAATLAHAGGEQ